MIEIKDRCCPFSHSLGIFYVIPSTSWQVQVFPCLLRFFKQGSSNNIELKLHLKGPIVPFTVEQDLEEGCIRIFGQSKDGYFRFIVQRHENVLRLICEKAPSNQITIESKGKIDRLEKSGSYEIAKVEDPTCIFPKEKLFLGISKQQDFDLIRRRNDLREILPLWHRLGQISPDSNEQIEESSVGKFLCACKDKIVQNDKIALQEMLLQLFWVSFSGGFVPRLNDECHQGILAFETSSLNPFPLLRKGSMMIRSLFFQEEKEGYRILPCLLPLFASGRMIQIVTECKDVVDMEWSKKQLKKMRLLPAKERKLKLFWPSHVQSYRLRLHPQDKGIILGREDPIFVKEGTSLLFDRFQK